MILRRVISHFRNQEWTAIALDFLIVVIGVFVGLQVNNWNAARAEQATVAGHLSEIAEDLQAQLNFNDALIGSAAARITAVDFSYAEAFGQTLPKALVLSTQAWTAPDLPPFPEEQRDNLMGAINLVRVTVSARNGYESLISSGHLGLIRNRRLAREIQAYYGNFDDLLNINDVFRTFRNDGARDQYQFGISVFDERPPKDIIAAARDHPEFAAYLRSQREWAILPYSLLEDLRAQTETVLADVQAELAALS